MSLLRYSKFILNVNRVKDVKMFGEIYIQRMQYRVQIRLFGSFDEFVILAGKKTYTGVEGRNAVRFLAQEIGASCGWIYNVIRDSHFRAYRVKMVQEIKLPDFEN